VAVVQYTFTHKQYTEEHNEDRIHRTEHIITIRIHIHNNKNTLLTYLLTPWSRVLLEKLTASAASQEIPRIFGTRMFVTVLTSAR